MSDYEEKNVDELEEIRMERFKTWLRKAIKYCCDENGFYVVESTGYDDNLEASTILDAYDEYVDYLKTAERNQTYPFETSLLLSTWEMFGDVELEESFIQSLEYGIRNEDDGLQEFFRELNSTGKLIDTCYECGYTGIKLDLESFLKDTYHLNLLLSTEQEKNYDMGCIPDMNKSVFSTSYDGSHNVAKLDNAMTYLVKQQGYSFEELLTSLDKRSKNEDYKCSDPFMESVVNEIRYNPCSQGQLTVLVQASGTELCDLLDSIAKGEGEITVSPDTTLGVFNTFNGSGSDLDIKLDKDFTFPASMVETVQLENTHGMYGRQTGREWTVDQTYGLVGECWDETAKLTHGDGASNLYDELKDELKTLSKRFADLSIRRMVDYVSAKGVHDVAVAEIDLGNDIQLKDMTFDECNGVIESVPRSPITFPTTRLSEITGELISSNMFDYKLKLDSIDDVGLGDDIFREASDEMERSGAECRWYRSTFLLPEEYKLDSIEATHFSDKEKKDFLYMINFADSRGNGFGITARYVNDSDEHMVYPDTANLSDNLKERIERVAPQVRENILTNQYSLSEKQSINRLEDQVSVKERSINNGRTASRSTGNGRR